MKILMISTDRAMFDTDSAVSSRILEQASLVGELHIVVFTPKEEKFQKLHPTKHLTITPTRSSGKFAYLLDAYRIARAIIADDGHVDKWLITTQDPFETGAVGYLLSLMLSVPLHLQLHTDPWSREWKKETILNRARFMLMLFLLRQASGVRVVSMRVEKNVIRAGVPSAKLTRAPIYTDIQHFMTAQRTFDLHASYPTYSQIVLSMGRLQPEKNYRMLIRAFARVREKNREAMLIIVGSGPLRDRLVSLVRTLGLGNAVVLLPWARDVASYYRSCDVYVQPSLYEGWGLAVVEAMASGAPVIMSDVGLAGELLRDDETGLVVVPGDEQALEGAIERMLGEPQLRARLGAAGREEVKKCATKAETLMLYKISWEHAYAQRNRKNR